MRLLNLVSLLPLALAAPAKGPIAELSTSEWTSIQSGFVDGFRHLSGWSWNKASEVVQEIESTTTGKDDQSDLTIWQILKADPNSFSKLVKIIEFEEKAIKYLDDKDSQITFFAPNNDAIKPPPHGHPGHHDGHHHDHDDEDDSLFIEMMRSPSLVTVSAALESDASLLSDDHDDDDKKKRRKEILKYIIGKVLQYHGLTKAYTAKEIAENSTLPTALKADDGSYGGLHRRIKVEKRLVPPSVVLNFFSKVVYADKKARNGYLHSIDFPLIPPPSIFEVAYQFPDFYSTLTSAAQRLGGEGYLDYTYDKEASTPGHPKFKGVGLVTFFAPTNGAFSILPPKLKAFLFSPFGGRVLTKILEYHYIPDTLLLTELLYQEKKNHADAWDFSTTVESMQYFDNPTFHKEFDIAPVYPNSTLHIEIEKVKVLPIEGATKIILKVNGQTVLASDVPARNGAIHSIGRILVPPHHHHDHDGEDIAHLDSWENWEDWVPTWAAELDAQA